MAKTLIEVVTKGLNEAKSGLKELKKDFKDLGKDSLEPAMFNKINKEMDTLLEYAKSLKSEMKGMKDNGLDGSKAYEKLEASLRKVNYQIRERKNLMKNSSSEELKTLEKNITLIQKEEASFQRSISTKTRLNQIDKERIELLKQQQREADKLNQKAKESGSLTKSLLQNEGLNSKGAKNTQAQYEYQINALKETLTLIKQTSGAQEQYNHALESMVYEVKHVTGKELYKDALDSVKEITRLENQRYEAQKSGKQVMEDYYNSEITKQKEVLNNLLKLANDPAALKEQLQSNYQIIFDSLKDMPNIQADFAAKFKETGNLTQAWSEGMKQFVIEAQKGIAKQEEFNQKRLEQYNIEQKEKEYLSLLKQKFQLEDKIAQLEGNKDSRNKNQNLISTYKQQTREIQSKINSLQQEYQIEGKIPEKINEATAAHKREHDVIIAKNKDINNTNGMLSDTLKNFMKFTVYYSSIRLLKQGIQEALDTMKELDKAFNDVRIVTQDSAAETQVLAKEYNQLAKEMGSTTTEVAEGAVEWLRQGKTAEETTQLLKTSMTLAKVGAMESSQATELLTSTMNGYKFKVKEAMSVVDKMTAIDLEAATSTEELATALSRTANMASNSGVSFEKLLGMIGTVSSVTRRSAETIRRSL